MSKILWDQVGEHIYETGTKHGVLYRQVNGAYPLGVAWNGLTAVSESPEGAEPTDIYADDIKYLTLRSAENFKATIEAYTYPDEFAECDGSAQLMAGVNIGMQPRKSFGFSYVTTVGNDTELDSYGYKIHLVWGATVSPSEKSYQTINDSPEAITFSWEMDTVPVPVTGHKATAHMTIDSTKFNTTDLMAKLAFLEGVLYGNDASEAVAATYKATTDQTKQAGKTYYTKAGNTYTEFSGDSFASGTTYYEIDTPAQAAVTASDPHLPLPDDVLYILQNGQERS